MRQIFIGILLASLITIAILGLGYSEAKNELTSTKEELESTRAELEETQNRFAITQRKLTDTQAELTKMQDELKNTYAELAKKRDELTAAQGELSKLREHISELKEYADRRYYEGLEAGRGHGYTIKDPTYQEMIDFIAQDQTDKNEYIEGKYECRHFARDVCNNAEERGIRCAYVLLDFKEGGHSIVAFNTIDKGLIYIEPQGDEEMKPEIGRPYWPRVRYSPPPYDDTIVDIIVIW